MDAREALEAVSRGYYEPHPCGPCDLGVTSAPCNCLPAGESARRMSAALRAVLDMVDTSEREGLAILPAAVRREIADALAGEG